MIRQIQRGFSLIEIMVAVFVLAVGVLGVGALQVTSKRANFEAVQRATAVAMAQDVIERMRANPTQLAEYTFHGVELPSSTSTVEAQDCSAACTPERLVHYDLGEFERTLTGVAEQTSSGTNTGGLTSPKACITGPAGGAGGSGNYVVAIAWRGLTRLANPTTQSDCGENSGLYDAAAPSDNLYRRVLVVETFIAVPI